VDVRDIKIEERDTNIFKGDTKMEERTGWKRARDRIWENGGKMEEITGICARGPEDGSDRQEVGKLGKEENGWKP
jgi:hypothetical protein